MPLQNRIDPFSNLVATSDRGLFMGNRGCLHNGHQQIVRHHVGARWIICLLSFKNRRLTEDQKSLKGGLYTPLFFLDEATALAAGHRPCAECQRNRFKAFLAAWSAANPDLVAGQRLTATRLDAALHSERLTSTKAKATYQARLHDLPPGVMVVVPDGAQPHLILADGLRPWSFAGYGEPVPCPEDTVLTILTPRSTVGALQCGYVPQLHPSANQHV